MATHLYGLLLARNAPRVAGLRAPARLLACDDLAAVVATVADPEPRATVEDLRDHDAVLRQVVAAGVTVVAAKFAQRFPDDDSCREHVRGRAAAMREVLERHDGEVEMRLVRRAPPADTPPAATSGREYLEQLRAARERINSSGVAGALGAVVRAEEVSELPNAVLSIAHRVRAGDVDRYRESVRARPELRDAQVVGPLALYSFTA